MGDRFESDLNCSFCVQIAVFAYKIPDAVYVWFYIIGRGDGLLVMIDCIPNMSKVKVRMGNRIGINLSHGKK